MLRRRRQLVRKRVRHIQYQSILHFPEKPPKRFLVEVARSQQEILEEELVLENVRHAYTDEFKALTSGFYLNH